MIKIKLDIDTLQVESFDTGSSMHQRGTVRANASDLLNHTCLKFPFTMNTTDTFDGTCALDGCQLSVPACDNTTTSTATLQIAGCHLSEQPAGTCLCP